MRSPRGFFGAGALLLALPAAALCEALLAKYGSAVVHFFFAAGSWLIAWSAGDFRLPGWMQWTARLSSGVLGSLFFLQGTSELLVNPSLSRFAYEVLGQRLEAWLVSLFLLWFVALLLLDSGGRTRTVGFLAVSMVVCLDGYSHVLPYMGGSLNEQAPGLKILYLLLPAWFLLESGKQGGKDSEATPAPAR